ncbi:uncharacterized protein BDV14DRAFT_205797 [Aspergillus stella-maris]|uniref:uncharacterized protein n=1 Tax=Aspergillus stella-maris TaxID=1810926 RepID=UPI003CCE2592
MRYRIPKSSPQYTRLNPHDNLPKYRLTEGTLYRLRQQTYRVQSIPLQRPSRSKFARSIVRTFSESDVRDLLRFSRSGGPELGDLRGYPPPTSFNEYSIEPTESGSSDDEERKEEEDGSRERKQ